MGLLDDLTAGLKAKAGEAAARARLLAEYARSLDLGRSSLRERRLVLHGPVLKQATSAAEAALGRLDQVTRAELTFEPGFLRLRADLRLDGLMGPVKAVDLRVAVSEVEISLAAQRIVLTAESSDLKSTAPLIGTLLGEVFSYLFESLLAPWTLADRRFGHVVHVEWPRATIDLGRIDAVGAHLDAVPVWTERLATLATMLDVLGKRDWASILPTDGGQSAAERLAIVGLEPLADALAIRYEVRD